MRLPKGFKYTAAFKAGRPRHERYDDFYQKHPPMERGRRAKIFAPFDALEGYSESIKEKNIEYVERIVLEPSAQAELNRRFRILHNLTWNGKAARKNNVKISVKYFLPCSDRNHFAYQMKGRYVTAQGICQKVDSEETKTIKIGDTLIPLADIVEINAVPPSLFEYDEEENDLPLNES